MADTHLARTFHHAPYSLDAAGMAKQYWPERLILMDEMPHTPSGKIQKFKLREEVLTSK